MYWAASIVAVSQTGQVTDPLSLPGPDRVLDRVQDQQGRRRSCRPIVGGSDPVRPTMNPGTQLAWRPRASTQPTYW
jgi:hypothetical protein